MNAGQEARLAADDLQRPAAAGKRIAELRSLVQVALDQLDHYGESLATPRTGIRIGVEHPLRLALDDLTNTDPEAFGIGTEGRWLVTSLLIGSHYMNRPSDRLALFRHANELAAWLKQCYLACGPTVLGRTDPPTSHPRPGRQGGSPAEVGGVHPPFPELGPTCFDILQATDEKPRRGAEIADRAGYAYDTVRRHLPRLTELGLITKTNRGYYRACSRSEHVPATAAAQTTR